MPTFVMFDEIIIRFKMLIPSLDIFFISLLIKGILSFINLF